MDDDGNGSFELQDEGPDVIDAMHSTAEGNISFSPATDAVSSTPLPESDPAMRLVVGTPSGQPGPLSQGHRGGVADDRHLASFPSSAERDFNRPSGDAEQNNRYWVLLTEALERYNFLKRDDWNFDFGGRAHCDPCRRGVTDPLTIPGFPFHRGINYTIAKRKDGVFLSAKLHVRYRQLDAHAVFHASPPPLPLEAKSPDDPRVFLKTLTLFAATRQYGASMRGSQRQSELMSYIGIDEFVWNGPLGQQVKQEHSVLFMKHLADVALEEKLTVMRLRVAYGVTADELSDSGGTALTVRGVFLNADRDGVIYTDDVLLGIVKLGSDRAARHLLLEILLLLDARGLDIVRWYFLATDGAAVFVGHLSGLITILERHWPVIIVQWCASHKLALFNKAAQPKPVVATLEAAHVATTCFVNSTSMADRVKQYLDGPTIDAPGTGKVLHPTDVKFKSVSTSVSSLVYNLPAIGRVINDVESEPSKFQKQAHALVNAFKPVVSERLPLLQLLAVEDWTTRVAHAFSKFETGIVLFADVDREIGRLRTAIDDVKLVTEDTDTLPSWFRRTTAACNAMASSVASADADGDAAVDQAHLQSIRHYQTNRPNRTRRQRTRRQG